MFTASSLFAIGVDLVAITLLAVGLYYTRHHRRDLMFSYVTLNVGVMAVAMVLGTASGGVGLGLGLFGVLSIIRLRSDPISQAEVAYYFSALALGLIGGLASSVWWAGVSFSVLLLAVVYLADHPRWARRTTFVTLTLDRAVLDPAQLRTETVRQVGGRVRRLDVREVDLVRDMTLVDVWFEHPAATRRRGSAVAERAAEVAVPAGLAAR